MPHVPVMWLIYDEYGYLERDGYEPEPEDGWIPNVLAPVVGVGSMSVTHKRTRHAGTPREKIEYLVKVVVNSHIPNIGKLFQ